MVRLTRRTQIVWSTFALATIVVVALLSIGDTGVRDGFLASNPILVTDEPATDPIFRTAKGLDHDRWTGIVIHHLGQPAGDPDSIREAHQSFGYASLGYHFLVGNGAGMGDGDLFVGERWVHQQPGAHTVGPDAERHNHRSIGICLIGNGDRRPFTEAQIRTLASLIQRLQREFDIPIEHVFEHCDVAPEVTSPGRFFARGLLTEQLLGQR